MARLKVPLSNPICTLWGRIMRQNHDHRVNEQALAEQKNRAKRERTAEKRRKKTRDKHRALGLEHTKKHQRTHSGLDGGIPVCTEAKAINPNDFCWQCHSRGLFELPVAA
jgi:hypothetical protein